MASRRVADFGYDVTGSVFTHLATTGGTAVPRGRVAWSVKKMLNKPPRATVWVAPSQAPVDRPDDEPKPGGRVLWSERPFAVASGICLGVQLRNGVLMVAFRAKASPARLDWTPAARVLSAADAERWAKMRFTNR